MATQMLENGAGLRWIQAMLGYRSVESTQIYTQVSIRGVASGTCQYLSGRADSSDSIAIIYYYSNERISLNSKRLSPVEYRAQASTLLNINSATL